MTPFWFTNKFFFMIFCENSNEFEELYTNLNPNPQTYNFEEGRYKFLQDSWLILKLPSGKTEEMEINKSEVLDIIEITRTPGRIYGVFDD